MAQSIHSVTSEELVSGSPELQQVIESEEFKHCKFQLPIILGTDQNGKPVLEDLASLPHLIIGGSDLIMNKPDEHLSYVQNLIAPIFLKRKLDEVRIVLQTGLDPKTVQTIESLRDEMEQRFQLLMETKSQSIAVYNNRIIEHSQSKLPYIILYVDNFSSIYSKAFETNIVMLAQKARAVGIHIIMSTPIATSDVLTGILKANFPARIASECDEKDAKRITDRREIGGIDVTQLVYVNGDKCLRLNKITPVSFSSTVLSLFSFSL